jgi:hypothetical protein
MLALENYQLSRQAGGLPLMVTTRVLASEDLFEDRFAAPVFSTTTPTRQMLPVAVSRHQGGCQGEPASSTTMACLVRTVQG